MGGEGLAGVDGRVGVDDGVSLDGTPAVRDGTDEDRSGGVDRGAATDTKSTKTETKNGGLKNKNEPVLAWMKRRALVAVDDGIEYPVGGVGGLHPKLRAYLLDNGFPTIFGIQKAVWEVSHGGMVPHHDVCFSAPTGSGKTLAYALPILNALASRVDLAGSLGCVVVLPTRGLAVQVGRVFEGLGGAVGLKTVVACGGVGSGEELVGLENADVAIFTPGRLVAHIERTYGFYAGRLAGGKVPFLVVDEADRLLRQRYNDWLAKLGVGEVGVKFIVSATLTRDPVKLDVLRLNAPRYVTFVQEENRYRLPKRLRERKVVVGEVDKPSALLGLLKMHEGVKTMVFVSSVEAAGTLAGLLRTEAVVEALGLRVEEYSGRVGKHQREVTVEHFARGETEVLVCSDAITRGIDIPNVELVINYDAPVYAKTYVHRAGRTARAGREGKVVTMLRKEDVRHFKSILRKADNNYVQDEVLGEGWGGGIAFWRRVVEDGLRELRDSSNVDAVDFGGNVGGYVGGNVGGKGDEKKRNVDRDGQEATRRKRKEFSSMRLPEIQC